MEYKKEDITSRIITKDRPNPYKSGGGPRDQQRRLRMIDRPEGNSFVNDTVIKELRAQIENLTRELSNNSGSVGGFTAEQVDEEIRKAVVGAVSETEARSKNKINKLIDTKIEYEKKISNLEFKIRDRDKIVDDLKAGKSDKISELTQKIESLTMTVAASNDVAVETDPDRPQIEEVFIDPIEEADENRLESHVNIADVTLTTKFKMDEKVDKLKSMMEKLPNLKR